MSATGRSSATAPAASDAAGRLTDAGFVRLVGAATGDGLAASGVLARTLAALDRPFQISVAPPTADVGRSTDADLTVAVGRSDATTDLQLPGTERPASETALAVARELGALPDDESPPDGESSPNGENTGAQGEAEAQLVALALAGVVADGRVAGSDVAERARAVGIERRPALAIPTSDAADGLAHSTFVHTSVSGDSEAAAELLADHGFEDVDSDERSEDDRRRLSSLVALEAVGSDDVPSRGGDAVERMLRPFAGGPVETVDGYADVLDATARERPGTAIALALGNDVVDDALDAWRSHGRRAHRTVRDVETSRYDGLYVAESDEPDVPVGTVARLLHAFRSPEPVTLVATDGAAAVVAADGVPETTIRTAATAVDGTSVASGTTGRARYDADATAFVTAFREASE